MKLKKMSCCWLGVAGLGGQNGAWGIAASSCGGGTAKMVGRAARARERMVEKCMVRQLD